MSVFLKSSAFRCFSKDNIFIIRQLSTRQIPRTSKALRPKQSFFGEGGYILLAVPIITFGLGTWQVQRRKWKLGLIEDLENRTQQPPIPLPLNLDELEDLEYRKVTVCGKFDHSREMIIGPRSNLETADVGGGLINVGGPQTGVHIVTPFKLSDRDLTILVNRGWVPPGKKKPQQRSKGQIEGEVTLTGVVRHTEKRQPFVPVSNRPQEGFWLYRVVDEMAEHAETAPVFIDADRFSTVDGGPLGGQTRVTLRNEHLSYIITWYSLSAITFWMWYRRFRRPPPPDSAYNYLKKQS